MNVLIQALTAVAVALFGEKLAKERIIAPSTAVGAGALTIAGLAGAGEFPAFPDGSLESYIVMLIVGAVGVYGVLKKRV